jgi:uncharacterized protein YcbX
MDCDPKRAGKPLTGRQQRRLLAYRARAAERGVEIAAPDGRRYAVDDSAWIEALEREIGKNASLQRNAQPMHDDSDVLVVNLATLRAIEREYGQALNVLRFRPNVVLDADDAESFSETAWMGRFRLGSAIFEASHPCERCAMITIDPQNQSIEPALLRMLVERYEGKFGTYFRVAQGGTVRVGDAWKSDVAVEA